MGIKAKLEKGSRLSTHFNSPFVRGILSLIASHFHLLKPGRISVFERWPLGTRELIF
jgi:hypothetical protein